MGSSAPGKEASSSEARKIKNTETEDHEECNWLLREYGYQEKEMICD